MYNCDYYTKIPDDTLSKKSCNIAKNAYILAVFWYNIFSKKEALTSICVFLKTSSVSFSHAITK